MRTLEGRIDRLVKAVKADLADKSVVFIHAFSAEKIQTPPTKYLVSVSSDEVGVRGFVADDRGGIVTADLTFRVYAPRSAKGEELNRLCGRVADLIRAEGGTEQGSVTVSKIYYDTSVRTVYRDIKVQIAYPKGVKDE